MEVSKAIWCSPELSARTRGSAVPSILGSFPSVTLRTLSGGFAGTLSLFPLWEAQHCGQDGRDFLVIMEKCQQGTGEKHSTQTSPPTLLCPWTRRSGPRGFTSVWFPSYCTVWGFFVNPCIPNFFLWKNVSCICYWKIKCTDGSCVHPERPKGQTEGGGNSANRPSHCPARPCCTVSPLLILFLQPQSLRTGGTHLSSSSSWFALPSHSLSTTETRNSSFSSALSPLPKFSIPASNLGDKPEYPHKRERRQQNRRHSCLQNTSALFWKWPREPPHKSAGWGLCAGSFPRIPQGATHRLRSDSCGPRGFRLCC